MTRSDDLTESDDLTDSDAPTCSDAPDPADSLAPDLPEGTLVRSRVESDPAAPLSTALGRELTGYAVLEPQDALLLDGDGAGVLAFEEGVPRFAYHTGTDRGGPSALADLATPGPFSVELRELPDLPAVAFAESERDRSELRVPPGMAADRLAGDPDLAERTRTAAPPEWEADAESGGEDGSLDAVEAFLDDEEKIAAIRDRAREEARERAERWGLDGELE
jgi:hypothetical protein